MLPDVVWSPLERKLFDALPGERIVPKTIVLPGLEAPRRLAHPPIDRVAPAWENPLAFLTRPEGSSSGQWSIGPPAAGSMNQSLAVNSPTSLKDEAFEWLERELALEGRGHMYARECAANTWYAIGAIRLRRGDEAAAREAFEQAIARVLERLMAHAGLALLERGQASRSTTTTGSMTLQGTGSLTPRSCIDTPPPAAAPPLSVDAAVMRASALVAAGDTAGAVRLVGAALAPAPPGSAGWLLPIEPLLGVQRAHTVWAPVLATLRTRAA